MADDTIISDYQKLLDLLDPQVRSVLPPPAEPETNDLADIKNSLANIEQAILTVAESVKYFADTYTESNKKPAPKPKKTYHHGAYHEWLEDHGYEAVPFRKVRVGDIIIPNGKGGRSPERWEAQNRVCEVTDASLRGKGIEYKDVINGEYGGGCFNDEGRFTVFEKRQW